jgi:hypothetical protein
MSAEDIKNEASNYQINLNTLNLIIINFAPPLKGSSNERL